VGKRFRNNKLDIIDDRIDMRLHDMRLKFFRYDRVVGAG